MSSPLPSPRFWIERGPQFEDWPDPQHCELVAIDYEAAVTEMYVMDEEAEVDPATRLGYVMRIIAAALPGQHR